MDVMELWVAANHQQLNDLGCVVGSWAAIFLTLG